MTFEDLVTNVVKTAFNLMIERTDAIYLYYSPGRPNQWGALFVFRQSHAIPLGYELASNERVPRSLTVPELRDWIQERAKVLPLLPVEVKS